MTDYLEARARPLDQLGRATVALSADAAAYGSALERIKSRLGTAQTHWQDSTASAAARRTAAEERVGQGLIAAAEQLAEILRRAREDTAATQDSIRQVAADAAAAGLPIDGDGIVAPGVVIGGAGMAQDLTAAMQSALRRMDEIDRAAAAELDLITNRLAHPRSPSPTPRPAPELPTDASPTQNREFWDALDERQQAELIRAQPTRIGGLDGLPAQARHLANLSRLDPELRRLTARRAELQPLVEASRVPALDPNRIRLWQTQRKIDDVVTLKRIVHEVDSTRLLSMDLRSGARGMAAISFGDTDAADHVAVTIPGMNTNIADSFWTMSDEARWLRSLAQDLLDRAGRHRETVATIMWLGYQPPQITGPNGRLDTLTGGVAATMTSAARAGGPPLANFFEGLQVAAANPAQHLTALGHSYGSYTLALALQDPNPGQPVDDAVFYGSPGINASREIDLGLAAGHGFVMRGERDRIDLVDSFRLFGPDPTRTGLVQLSTTAATTPDGIARQAAINHADYGRSVDGQLRISGFNMAAIAAGLADWAIRR